MAENWLKIVCMPRAVIVIIVIIIIIIIITRIRIRTIIAVMITKMMMILMWNPYKVDTISSKKYDRLMECLLYKCLLYRDFLIRV